MDHRELPSGEGLVHQGARAHVAGVVLTAEEAVQFLLRAAVEYDIAFCTTEGCEVCLSFCSTWKEVYDALPAAHQRIIDTKIIAGEILRPVPVGWGR